MQSIGLLHSQYLRFTNKYLLHCQGQEMLHQSNGKKLTAISIILRPTHIAIHVRVRCCCTLRLCRLLTASQFLSSQRKSSNDFGPVTANRELSRLGRAQERKFFCLKQPENQIIEIFNSDQNGDRCRIGLLVKSRRISKGQSLQQAYISPLSSKPIFWQNPTFLSSQNKEIDLHPSAYPISFKTQIIAFPSPFPLTLLQLTIFSILPTFPFSVLVTRIVPNTTTFPFNSPTILMCLLCSLSIFLMCARQSYFCGTEALVSIESRSNIPFSQSVEGSKKRNWTSWQLLMCQNIDLCLSRSLLNFCRVDQVSHNVNRKQIMAEYFSKLEIISYHNRSVSSYYFKCCHCASNRCHAANLLFIIYLVFIFSQRRIFQKQEETGVCRKTWS